MLFSFGHGYVATALSRHLLAEGWAVTGTSRSRRTTEQMGGVAPLLWPGDDIAPALARATHLLVSAPPGETGDPLLAAHRATIINSAPHLRWIGYLSTTGVYGDHGGARVDEDCPTLGQGPRNLARIEAESAWRALPDNPAQVFRLSGIYGPGRGPFVRLRAGEARRIVKPGHLFGRIHVDDITQVLLASMADPRPGRIYNVADDEPAPGDEVITYAAGLLGITPPPEEPFETAEMSLLARSFYQGRRVIANDRIKDELGIRLLYPGYREGLAAILRGEADQALSPH